MVPEVEKPRVTELYVRMDCNGCVQKIKKALHGINGIYDTYIDFPRQKLTVVGWVEPEKIIRAIKKTKKIATICNHTESTDSTPQPTEPPPPPEAAAPDATTPPTEPPPAEATPPTEPPKEDPPPPENQPTETPPPTETQTPESSPSPETQTPESSPPPENPPPENPKEEIHVIHHHHSHDNGYGYGSFWNDRQNDHKQWNNYPNEPEFRSNQPIYTATHSYNTHKPSRYISEYYQNVEEPPRYTNYSRMEHQHRGGDYQNYEGNGAGSNITSMFSDENPNACRIV